MKNLFVIAIMCVAALKAKAQDINFSQFYELPLLRNPATAGLYEGDYRITAAFRNQWASVTTPYKTAAVGVESRMPVVNTYDYLSLGCQITHDQAGDSRLTKTQVLPLIAYHKSVNSEKDAYVTIGVSAGGSQQRFDPSELRFSDQFIGGAYSQTNPTQQTFQHTNKIYWDAAIGLTYSSIVGEDVRFYFGTALFHFNSPTVAFSEANNVELNKKYVINAGLSGPVYETGRLVVYGDFFAQGGNSQMQCGLLYQHRLVTEGQAHPITVSMGSIYRWNDALVPVIQLEFSRFSTGFSYDVNMSTLKKASYGSGGAELTLSYRGLFKNNSTASGFRCPVTIR